MKRGLTSAQRAWFSVFGAFLISSGAGLGGALSLFYLPVGSELGFSQTSLGLYVSLMSLCGIVSQPVVGRILNRYSRRIRLVAVGGAVLGFACYAWLSTCSRLWQFYIGGIGMGFLLPIVGALYGSSVVTHWFAKKRSVAISIVAVGTSLGTVLYSQVGRFFIDFSGWRSAYLAMGVVIAIITLVGTVFISPPPEYLGMKPYGWEEPLEGKTALTGFSLQEALRTKSFWLFAVATFFGSAYVMGIQQSLIPMLQIDFSFTASLAATLMSIYSIICGASKPLMGVIFEKQGVKRSVIIIWMLITASLVIIVTGSGVAAALTAMVFLGVGNMFGTVIMPSYVAEAFGNKAHSAIFGYMNIPFALGVSIGPVLSGKIFDLLDSYRVGYFIFMGFCLLSTALTLLSRRSLNGDAAKLARKKEETANEWSS